MNDARHPYQRLQGALAEIIAASQPGQRLPSEPDLSRKLGVSRATLREAMRYFESMGLVRRRQGVGTFAAGPGLVIDSGLEVLESIETLAQRTGLAVTFSGLQVEQVKASRSQAEALAVPAGQDLVRIARVITAASRPVAYLIDLLPVDILPPQDLDQGFTGSVLDMLLSRGDPVLALSRTEVRAVTASREAARALQIMLGDVLLEFIAYLYSESGQVIDYSLSYFLPGYFRFHVVRSVGRQQVPTRLQAVSAEGGNQRQSSMSQS